MQKLYYKHHSIILKALNPYNYYSSDKLNSLLENNSAKPDICFKRNISSLSIPILRCIQASDMPHLESSETIGSLIQYCGYHVPCYDGWSKPFCWRDLFDDGDGEASRVHAHRCVLMSSSPYSGGSRRPVHRCLSSGT